jgi:hypothetical protein
VSIGSCLDEEARYSRPPFVRCWDAKTAQLPVRLIHAPARARAHPLSVAAPPWLPSGPANKPFDFCGHIRRLCADIVASCEDLRHIDVSRLLFSVAQARSARPFGLQARVTPLRFHGGELVRRRHSTTYRVQRYFVGRREMLYVVAFLLPRFLDQDFDDKFITLFHELYHISPRFDGDLRRMDGRCTLHSESKRGYDAYMADLARAYLGNGADPKLHSFLRLNFAQLQHRHSQVVGVVVPRPKLIPLLPRRARSAAGGQ